MRADVIVNRNASRLASGSLRDAIVRVATQEGAAVHETRTLEELDAAVRAIAERGSRGVVLAGGDGTHMAGVTALARAMRAKGEALPPIGLAPGGTVATVAKNWGMRGDARACAEAVVRATARGARTVERPTLSVRDDADGDRIGFIFGAGLVSNFFDAYYAAPEQGNATAAKIVARIFGGVFVGGALAERVLAPTPARLDVDGVTQAPRAWSLVAASVVRDLGIGMRLTYRAGERMDRFHAVASALGPRALGPQMPRVLAGRALKGEHHVDALARELRLRFGAETATRGSYILDGDPIAASDVRITCGPIIRVLTLRGDERS
jgi:diacylglycerol kinase family enzyme